ncbi:MAG: FAD-dependent oxidoreductase [Anaerolineales bacterium]|nr:FAD-dependent oxidoreductase [Anaerolineales bacterium]
MSHVVVVGSSYAGIAAALELHAKLPDSDKITVVSASEDYLFYPSLIWIVQGERELSDISFPIRPVLEKAGVSFISSRMDVIDAENKTISLQNGQVLPYDKLLIATGGVWQWGTIPGLGPKPNGHTISILSPWAAEQARADWQALLANPGPVVIGVAPKASLYGAAYEFALNLDVALRKADVREQAPIVFVTPEPYLGHFGHDGIGNSRHILEEAFVNRGIAYVTEAQIDHIEADKVVLGNRQQHLPSKFTMIVPPHRGIEPVCAVPNLGDEDGRIPVDDYYRSIHYPDIFAAGAAVQVKPKVSTLLPCGVFVPGSVSSEMGRVTAVNLAADLGHGTHKIKPPTDIKSLYVLDSGGHGLLMSLGPQSWLNVQVNIPGPWSHWAKVITEKYQMWQIQEGRI